MKEAKYSDVSSKPRLQHRGAQNKKERSTTEDLSNQHLEQLPVLRMHLLRGLIHLDISHNSISSFDVLGRHEHINLIAFQTLKFVDLSHNHIASTKGLALLAKCAPHLSSLQVQHNPFTEQINYLSALLHLFVELRFVGIEGAKISMPLLETVEKWESQIGAAAVDLLVKIVQLTELMKAEQPQVNHLTQLKGQIEAATSDYRSDSGPKGTFYSQNDRIYRLLLNISQMLEGDEGNSNDSLDQQPYQGEQSQDLSRYLPLESSHPNLREFLIRYYERELTLKPANLTRIHKQIHSQLSIPNFLLRCSKGDPELVERCLACLAEKEVNRANVFHFSLDQKWLIEQQYLILKRVDSILAKISVYLFLKQTQQQCQPKKGFILEPKQAKSHRFQKNEGNKQASIEQILDVKGKITLFTNKHLLESVITILQNTILKCVFNKIRRAKHISPAHLYTLYRSLHCLSLSSIKDSFDTLFVYSMSLRHRLQRLQLNKLSRIFRNWKTLKVKSKKILRRILIKKSKKEQAWVSLAFVAWRIGARNIGMQERIRANKSEVKEVSERFRTSAQAMRSKQSIGAYKKIY